MFMPARQLLASSALGDSTSQGPKTRDRTMARKAAGNRKYGDPDMAAPITISHDDTWPGAKGRPVIYDGHHRLAKGLETNAELPLQHIDNDKNWWTL